MHGKGLLVYFFIHGLADGFYCLIDKIFSSECLVFHLLIHLFDLFEGIIEFSLNGIG